MNESQRDGRMSAERSVATGQVRKTGSSICERQAVGDWDRSVRNLQFELRERQPTELETRE